MKIKSVSPIKINYLKLSKYDNKSKDNKKNITSCDKLISYPKNYYINNDISFLGKRISAKQLIKNIGEENFPNPEIVKRLAETEDGADYSLYDIHTDFYKDLLDCETLDEAKELYPEFSDVIDAKDIDLSTLGNRNMLHKIAKGEIEGITIDDLSLELLKKYYGKMIQIQQKEEYWGFSSMANLFKLLNIKILNIKYSSAAAKQKAEYRKQASETTIKKMQDPKRRELMSKNQKHSWQNPNSKLNSIAYKRTQSEITKRNRHDPNSKYNTPGFREKMSRIMREAWADPESVLNSEEHREIMSEAMKEAWADPDSVFNSEEYRRKLTLALFERWKDPKARERQRQIMLERWKDPEYRQRMQIVFAANILAYERHPEITEVLKDTARGFYGLRRAFNKKKPTESDKRLISGYYKKCEERYPGYKKIIGEEQHRILIEWGFFEE